MSEEMSEEQNIVLVEEALLKEAKNLPWNDRLGHTNWKVRYEANVDLASVCDSITDPKDTRLRQFGDFVSKSLGDSNSQVQEKGLLALNAFLQSAGAFAGSYANAKEVCGAIGVKCLTGLSSTIKKAQQAFLLWVASGEVNVVMDTLEEVIKNKFVKAVVSAIDVMFQGLKKFGSEVISLERVLDMLPDLLYHKYKKVRTSAKKLMIQLCRLITIEPVTSGLYRRMNKAMDKELEIELMGELVAKLARVSLGSTRKRSQKPKKKSKACAAAPNTDEPPPIAGDDMVCPKPKSNLKWTADEEKLLTAAFEKHGDKKFKWRLILQDPDYAESFCHRSNVNLKDKWRNMLKKEKRERVRRKQLERERIVADEDPG